MEQQMIGKFMENLGLSFIAIAVILLVKWFFRNYEIKLK